VLAELASQPGSWRVLVSEGTLVPELRALQQRQARLQGGDLEAAAEEVAAAKQLLALLTAGSPPAGKAALQDHIDAAEAARVNERMETMDLNAGQQEQQQQQPAAAAGGGGPSMGLMAVPQLDPR
jgi:hypothetical protein